MHRKHHPDAARIHGSEGVPNLAFIYLYDELVVRDLPSFVQLVFVAYDWKVLALNSTKVVSTLVLQSATSLQRPKKGHVYIRNYSYIANSHFRMSYSLAKAEAR
jgi:hypothetical protein